MTERPQYAREIRYALTDPYSLCERLGLFSGLGSFKRQASGVIVRCPVHQERTPSCSVRVTPDGTIGWKCHGCQASGDALTLIAVVHGLSTTADFKAVLLEGAELAGLWSIVEELNSGVVRQDRPQPRPAPPPSPERDYPPGAEIAKVWAEASDVVDDLEACAWLESRGLDPDMVSEDDVARVLRVDASLPRWASYQGQAWTMTGHRLIVPMRDTHGVVRTVRASRLIAGDSPKRLPPGGHKATGVVMACPVGVAMLAGTATPSEVVIVEGEPDFLTWATRPTSVVTARLGIVSGSWSFDMAKRIPPETEVWVRTDHDEAGNRYAVEITKTLRWNGCFTHRGGREA